MRHELTDYEWASIKPFLPNKPRGVPRVNDRRVLNGILWVLRSGAPWRDLPESFGPYTCYNRLFSMICSLQHLNSSRVDRSSIIAKSAISQLPNASLY